MSEIKQRIIQAAVDGNVWLVGQLVDEMEKQHEKELQKIQETALVKIAKDFEAEVLANLFKRIQQNSYTILPTDGPVSETVCMEGENQFKNVNYKPCCKHGYDDCIYDPAYIYATYPEWYKKLYGDKLPEEITCAHCENGERWDDEDK
jgi:hypothetical protein